MSLPSTATKFKILLCLLSLPVLTVSWVTDFPGFSQSVMVAQSNDVLKAQATRLYQQGLQQAETGQLEAAISSWQQALVLVRKLKDTTNEARILNNLAGASAYLGRYTQAEQLARQALKLSQAIKDDYTQVRALIVLGNVYLGLGQYQRSLESQEQALSIADKLRDPENQIDALNGLGSLYNSLGLSPKALPYYQRTLDIAKRSNDREGLMIAMGNLGIVYQSLGNFPQALNWMQQALALAKQIKNPRGVATALSGLGSIYLDKKDYAPAIDWLQQAVKVSQQINDPFGAEIALGNLGTAYLAQQKYLQAIQISQQAIAQARQLQDRQSQADFLNTLGLAFSGAKQLTEAESSLHASIQIQESLRSGLSNLNKVALIDTQRNAYNNLQRVLVNQHKYERALEISERGRARAFIELLSQRLSNNQPVEQIPILTIAQIKQIAQTEQATLVEYSLIQDEYDRKLYIWVVSPTGNLTFRSVDLRSFPTSLSDLVAQTRHSIGARSRDVEVVVVPSEARRRQDQERQTQRLRQLYQLLIQPIADLLPADPKQRVVFIPQGVLFLVPFAALQSSNGQSLIEQHTILTAPSIQVLELTRKQRSAVNRQRSATLIVGDPTMPKIRTQVGEPLQQLSDLPGAKQEAEAIAQILQTKAITGSQARKSTVVQQMPASRLLHLATHGLLDDFTGLGVPGAIALAPDGTGQANDGLLTANEILDLKLQAELVVLSACDTGRGRITGDGVIGLSRSLITAGVPSIVVSLWKVPDDSTALLMTEFYKNLKTTPDKAQALRRAMLTTKAKYADPLHWAAFTLIGEAE